jgi:hypothetical protein
MKNILSVAILSYCMILSCRTKTNDFSDQLRANFQSHLKKYDSSVVLDSFAIVRIDSMTRRRQLILDDTIYMKEFVRVKQQLANSIYEKRSDSEYYREEVNYMMTQIDSMTREISKADSTINIGVLAFCKIRISKDNQNKSLVLRYLVDKEGHIWNTSMIDSTIVRAVRKLG